MSRRRPGTDDATRVRIASGDDELAAGLLPVLDDLAGPARRLSQARSAALVASIVDAAMTEAPASAAAGSRPAVRESTPRRLAPVLAAALIAAAVVGAAAAVVTTRYFTPVRAHHEPPPAPPAPAPAPTIAPRPPPPPAVETPAPATSKPARVRRPPPRDAAPERALPPDAPAEDVLALANQRRKERAWRDADVLYRRVIRAYPGTNAAVVAEVASATIRLEHLGDAAGALTGYRRALEAQPAGALGEEARWGIAEAFRAVGDARGEAFALRVYLQTHPTSAMAPAARQRLAELKP